MPYVVHLSNVAMEILIAAPHSPGFDLDFAIQVALLHDTLEDTSTTFDELASTFGTPIAQAVQALSKDPAVPKDQQMQDCLNRISQLPAEVGAVKLADRITNLQPPPTGWDTPKIQAYHQQAQLIANTLGHCNAYLHTRLLEKIGEYGGWVG